MKNMGVEYQKISKLQASIMGLFTYRVGIY